MDGTNQAIRWISIIFAVLLVGLVIFLIVRQFENYNAQNDPKLHELNQVFTEFFSQDKKWGGNLKMLNKRKPYQEVSLYKGDNSYTINKQRIFMCLKDEHGEYYPMNMLIYVLAHEYAHVLAKSIGHTDEFHAIFEDLLGELVDAGIYDPKQELITDYCQHDN